MIVMNFFWQVMIKDVVQKVFTDILAPTQDLRQGNRNDCIFRVKRFMMLLLRYIDVMIFLGEI
jgi:hypothetical protein